MLELTGNRTFACHLVGFLARPGGRLVLVTQEFTERGGAGGQNTLPSHADSLSDFNKFLRDLSVWQPSETGLRVLAVLAVALACALLLYGLPALRPGGARWARPHEPGLRPESPAALLALVREDLDARL